MSSNPTSVIETNDSIATPTHTCNVAKKAGVGRAAASERRANSSGVQDPAETPDRDDTDAEDLENETRTDLVGASPSDAQGIATSTPRSAIKLRSLAPEYICAEHGVYVRHLEDAIEDPRNRNIALTGRYGTGKSSVLDEFSILHKDSTIRISISTLGPAQEGEDLTNRIQKELVKQLIYRAAPGQLHSSRFARIKPLTPFAALWQSLLFTFTAALFLWLTGFQFSATAPQGLPGLLIAIVLFVCATLLTWCIRWSLRGRSITQLTGAGATLTLSDTPDTYFDKYLEEIVAFFDTIKPRFVIFEDLDRFDDPQIFDSLRELNNLINTSSNWPERAHQVRFIYAIKDSLFEQLGDTSVKSGLSNVTDHQSPAGDPARSEGVMSPRADRANRTKFFELVIPMVPFISHHTARDHLTSVLKDMDTLGKDISRGLLDLVSKHATDMRLLNNICNEYAVFAEHLLWCDRPAPGLTKDHLFALVAYKNFHLSDFESISSGNSTLDTLELHHRNIVRREIEKLQGQIREATDPHIALEEQKQVALRLGGRLTAIADGLRLRQQYEIHVNNQAFTPDQSSTVDLWTEVAGTCSLTIKVGGTLRWQWDADPKESLFPETTNSALWDHVTQPSVYQAAIQEAQRGISRLRGADFIDLLKYSEENGDEDSFDKKLEESLASELAQSLVRHGFINRNFAEYSSIFHDVFLGVDVAFYYNHSVQPNRLYLDHKFTTPNAVRNLLEQAPTDFTSSISVLHPEVIRFILQNDSARAREVAEFIATDHSPEVKTFLRDFFMQPNNWAKEALIDRLAAHPWTDLFIYIATEEGLPKDHTRGMLLNRALLGEYPSSSFAFDSNAREFLARAMPNLPAFTETQTVERSDRLVTFAREAKVVISDLRKIAVPLRNLMVTHGMFEITLNNLQTALDCPAAPTLDSVVENRPVWDLCRANIGQYMTAMESSGATYFVLKSDTFMNIVAEQHDAWSPSELKMVCERAAPEASLAKIDDVPKDIWPVLVETRRVTLSLSNVAEYVQAYGIDSQLASLLGSDGDQARLLDVEALVVDDRMKLASEILNVPERLSTRTAVRLVAQFASSNQVSVGTIKPREDDLLARLLDAKLVPDDLPTFSHFARGGWPAIEEAFASSDNWPNFITPTLVKPFIKNLFDSLRLDPAVKNVILDDLGAYVPDSDKEGLIAAAKYAASSKAKIVSLIQLERIARVTAEPGAVLPNLLRHKELWPAEIVRVVSPLGQPYAALQSGDPAAFDLPSGADNQRLFSLLERHGKVQIVQHDQSPSIVQIVS